MQVKKNSNYNGKNRIYPEKVQVTLVYSEATNNICIAV